MPEYFVLPLGTLVSAALALVFASLGAYLLTFLFSKILQRDELDIAFYAFFHAAPGIAIVAFVSCLSILVNWHHATSWRVPTFALAFSAILIWSWAHDFGGIGFAWYVPGIIAWLVSIGFLHRKLSAHSEHVIEA